MALAWRPEIGFFDDRTALLQTLEGARTTPILASSPWIRRYPQMGFSRASRRIIATVPAGVGPFPSDQVPVPAEQGFGLHEEPIPAPMVEQPTQPSKQSAIRGPQGRSDDLTAKHGDLVAEHDDLDGQVVPVPPAQAQQLEDPGEGEVEERHAMAQFRAAAPIGESPVQSTRMTFSAPTGSRPDGYRPRENRKVVGGEVLTVRDQHDRWAPGVRWMTQRQKGDVISEVPAVIGAFDIRLNKGRKCPCGDHSLDHVGGVRNIVYG